MNQILLTPAEAARILSIHPQTLRRWETEGKIVSSRTDGGHRRFIEQDVLELKRSLDLRNGVVGLDSSDGVNQTVKGSEPTVVQALSLQKPPKEVDSNGHDHSSHTANRSDSLLSDAEGSRSMVKFLLGVSVGICLITVFVILVGLYETFKDALLLVAFLSVGSSAFGIVISLYSSAFVSNKAKAISAIVFVVSAFMTLGVSLPAASKSDASKLKTAQSKISKEIKTSSAPYIAKLSQNCQGQPQKFEGFVNQTIAKASKAPLVSLKGTKRYDEALETAKTSLKQQYAVSLGECQVGIK